MLTFTLSLAADIFRPARFASPERWVAVWRRCEAVASRADSAIQPIEQLIVRAIRPMLVQALLFVALNGLFSFLAAMSLSELLAQLAAGGELSFRPARLCLTIGWTYAGWLTLNHVFVHAQIVGVAAKAFAERMAIAILGGDTVEATDMSVVSFIDRECGRIENAWGGSVMVALALTTLIVSGMFFVIVLGPAGLVALAVMGLASWVLWRLAGRLSIHYEELSVASRRRVAVTTFVSRARRSAVLNGWGDQLVDDHAIQRSAEEVPLRRIAKLVAAVNAISSITPVLALLLAAASQLVLKGGVSIPALLAGIAVIGSLKSVANGIPDAISNLTQGCIAHEGLNRVLTAIKQSGANYQGGLPIRRGKHVSIVGEPTSDRTSVLLAAASSSTASGLVFVPSEPTPFSGSVRAFLKTAAPDASDDELIRALMTVRLSASIMVDFDGNERQVGGPERQISRGQAKRLELARAVLSGANDVYLDQPSMGLDGATREGLLSDLLHGAWQEANVTFVTDYPVEAQLADETWTVSGGEVSSTLQTESGDRNPAGTPDRILSSVEAVSAVAADRFGGSVDAKGTAGAAGVITRLCRGGFGLTTCVVAVLLTLKEGLSIASDTSLTTGGWDKAPTTTMLLVAALMLATTAVAVFASVFTVQAVVSRSTQLCRAFFLRFLNSRGKSSASLDDPLGRATRDQRRIDESLPALMLESWGAAALLVANVAYVIMVAPVVAALSIPLAAMLLFLNIHHRQRLLQANSVDISRSSQLLQAIEDLTASLPRIDRGRRITLALSWLNQAMQARALASYESIRRQRSFGYQVDLVGLGWFYTVLLAAVHVGPANTQMALGLSLTYSLIAIFGRTSRTFLQLDQLLESSDRLLIPENAMPSYQPRPASGLLTFDNLHFRRDGATTPTIADLTATIQPGSLAVVLGPSGAGKSTMASLIVGELSPDAGRINLGSGPIPAPGLHPDVIQALDASPLFKPGPLFAHFGVESSEALDVHVRTLGLDDVVAALPGGGRFEVPSSGELPLSKSAAQMLALLRLATRPPMVAILDEATSELQGAEEVAFLDRVRRACLGTTIITITHNPRLRALSDLVLEFRGEGVVTVQ